MDFTERIIRRKRLWIKKVLINLLSEIYFLIIFSFIYWFYLLGLIYRYNLY